MIALVDRALALNPSFARGWHQWHPKAIGGPARHRDRACRWRAAPQSRARIGTSLLIIGAAPFYARRFDETVPKLLLAIQEHPSHPVPYRYLTACYAHMRRLDDAREIVTKTHALTPVVIPDASFLRNPEHRELFLSGLRLAAGEATRARPVASPRSEAALSDISRLPLEKRESRGSP
jgi:hypothetical protein